MKIIKKKAKDLIFISRILRDGSGVIMVDSEHLNYLNEGIGRDEYYTINCLSITKGTYIASGFNSYVVKIKY